MSRNFGYRRFDTELGLNGCHPRSHDSSACLIQNGKVIAFAEEERFTRQKRAFDRYPINATRFCLDEAGISENEVDAIAVGFQFGPDLRLNKSRRKKYLKSWFPFPVFKIRRDIPIYFVPHHLAHAASVFYVSGMEKAAILVLDGQGEREATSIFAGHGQTINFLKKYPVEKSLGFLYAAVSVFCGLGTFGAGKLMGLAPYGEPVYKNLIGRIFKSARIAKERSPDLQDEYIANVIKRLKEAGLRSANTETFQDLNRGRILKAPQFTRHHHDLAASVQVFLEE